MTDRERLVAALKNALIASGDEMCYMNWSDSGVTATLDGRFDLGEFADALSDVYYMHPQVKAVHNDTSI